jgi:hypothetical protein
VKPRRPHPLVVLALYVIASASQMMVGFTGPPTPFQLVMMITSLVAGGVWGWMTLPERRDCKSRPLWPSPPRGGGAHKKEIRKFIQAALEARFSLLPAGRVAGPVFY